MINSANPSMPNDSGISDVQSHRQRVLKMVHNPRMGGSVPAWKHADSSAEIVQQNLSQAQKSANASADTSALSYQDISANENYDYAQDEFTFDDLFDMVNPLHHIPVVNYIYREISGDTIKPIGQIVGGAVFGGAAGAASGLVNMIVAEETGKDIAGNALSMFNGDDAPQEGRDYAVNDPEQALSAAAENAGNADLPASLLAFTRPAYDTGIEMQRSGKPIRTADLEADRAAMKEYMQKPAPRMPITQVVIRNPSEIY